MRDSVVLPAPEGDDSTNISPRRSTLSKPPAVIGYSRFWTCSRNCSTTFFISSPVWVNSRSFDLEQQVLTSRLNSWARKSSRRPTGPPLPSIARACATWEVLRPCPCHLWHLGPDRTEC